MPAPTIYYIRHGETSWNAEGRLQGTQDIALNDLGRKAQEKIMGIPARLERIANVMEQKTKPKSFAFDVVFNRVFAME
jgi:broad specificity phosphatase PhoE